MSGPALRVHPTLLRMAGAVEERGKNIHAILDNTSHSCQALPREVEERSEQTQSPWNRRFLQEIETADSYLLPLHSVMLIRQLMLRLLMAGPTSSEAAHLLPLPIPHRIHNVVRPQQPRCAAAPLPQPCVLGTETLKFRRDVH